VDAFTSSLLLASCFNCCLPYRDSSLDCPQWHTLNYTLKF
jgi:hypothetical protein